MSVHLHGSKLWEFIVTLYFIFVLFIFLSELMKNEYCLTSLYSYVIKVE